jgi:hypothetical protein
VHTDFWCRNPLERGNLEDLGVDGRIILKYILKKLDGVWTEFIRLRIGERWRVVSNAVMKFRVS